ncbi:unnamed protein product [Fusarium graminearum]|nr:hypothetical protein FG05_05357 [Fusarium graminearum]CAF3526406.1 unnamed protein product [Fusarium graminearum]CAF3624239.1 unnamed protein product [Fusarium graminearum]CAG1962140.1 unnamed protein product [Fusarium graminearum]CAG2002013.1 unnamed protein product [Fusarium graminearum]
MCYFDQTRWTCGFWRWGHFRQQCNKEYRMGETCGLKLVYETKDQPEVCKLCSDVEKKQRRYDKMYRDVQRWQREGNRNATIERTCGEMDEVLGQIYRMQQEHITRLQTLGQRVGCGFWVVQRFETTDSPTGHILSYQTRAIYAVLLCSALPRMMAYASFGERTIEQRSTRTPTHVIL